MRKVLVLLIVLLSSLYFLSAERFYCITATDNVASSGASYRFNYSTVFDLSDYFSGGSGSNPLIPIYNDYCGNNNPSGKLNEQRALGTVGVAECSHAIEYTITAMNDGRFISQSDASKYREYYVVAVPDQGTNKQRTFYYPNGGNSNSVALNTRGTNVMTMTTVSLSNGRSMGIDLFLCMKELTDDDRLHLAPSDDYYATILVEWNCTNCNNAAHSGSFSITVRGYFGSSYSSAHDEIFLLITPTAESNNLNLKEIASAGSSKTISHFQINTTTVKKPKNSNNNNYLWSKHIFAFLSASPDYSVSDSNGFLLKKVGHSTTTIPYKLTVYNTTGGIDTAVYQVYDGKQSFTGSSDKNMCLNMDSYSKTFVDTYNDTYNAINYEGKINLSLVDFEIPGSGLSFFDVMQNPSVDQAHRDYYTSYIGRYESNIYYHIVYSDTPLN